MGNASDLTKLGLLMWKNWLLFTRNLSLALSAFVLPILLLAIMVYFRSTTDVEKIPDTRYRPLPRLNDNSFKIKQLAYYPKSYKDQMDKVDKSLQLKSTAIGFDTQEALSGYLADDKDLARAGIVFHSSDKMLKISLRFHTDSPWRTRSQWMGARIGTRDPKNGNGSEPSYYTRRFVVLQNAIFEALHGQPNETLMLNRMAIQSFKQDGFLSILLMAAGLFEFITFMYIFLGNVQLIIEEKKSGLNEMLLIMGVPNYVIWLSWILKSIIEGLLVSLVAIFVLSYPFFGTSAAPVACLTNTNALILVLFFLVFILSLSTFTTLVSTLMRSSNFADLWGAVIFMVASYPVSTSTDFRDLGWGMNAAVLLSSMGSFGIGFKTIIVFEAMGVGMQWDYLMNSPGGRAFSLLTLIVAMLMQSAVYLLLTLYLEQIFPGEFGVGRKWYFPVERFFKGTERMFKASEAMELKGRKCQQMPPGDAVPGIEMNNLTKIFDNNFVAVKDLSTIIYENEITILLGENGAGKSTTFSMLSGLIAPTSGSATIFNFDIRKDMKEIRNVIGLCPQNNVLFSKLTIKEHLWFFAMLKGLSSAGATREAEHFIERMGMKGKKDTKASQLSGGTMRKLSLCISLSGGTKMVLLDEPTSGVDPASRREIWNVLQEEKKHRTILLSTHFMDEADVLGDRVAIINHGELKCSGSAFFLKNLFESSYKLTCALMDGGKIEPVAGEIRKYVPDAQLRVSYGQEFSFDLSPKHEKSFGELFKRLETVGDSIGLESYGIELPSLEDVFLKVQRESEHETANPVHSNMNVYVGTALLTGCPLWLNQIKAVLLKKFYCSLRSPFSTIFQLIFPLLILAYFIYAHPTLDSTETALELSLRQFEKSEVLIRAEKGANSTLVANYKKLINETSALETVADVDKYILRMSRLQFSDFQRRTIIGAEFKEDQIVTWFNNEPLHSVPIAVTNVFNALIQTNAPEKPKLVFVNDPIPQRKDDPKTEPAKDMLQYAILLILVMSMWISTICLGYVMERASGAMNLQFVSGLSPGFYWLWSLLVDLTIYMIGISMAVGFYAAVRPDEMEGWLDWYLLFFVFGVSVFPFSYLVARWTDSAAKYVSTLTGIAVGFLVAFIAKWVFKVHGLRLEIMDFVGVIVPFYNLGSAMLHMEGQNGKLWQDYLIFVLTGVVWWVLLVLFDMQKMGWIYGWQKARAVALGELDEDVRNERNKVDAMTMQQIAQKSVVAKHLRKSYGDTVAVKDSTFILENGECLGLLGKNGAGKTTTFKMLTGEETITEGDAWLKGISVKSDLLKTYKYFGYCPQINALLDDMTGMETMEMISLIRGVPANEIRDFSVALAHELGFEKHAQKMVAAMSGGNKRKLNTALALIGDPEVVYMDEPTTGMDPSAKRMVWNVVNRYRQRGHSLVLTSHSMDECEALCTRLIILFEGKMEAIATSYQLKQKYSKTGHLVIQMERTKGRTGVGLEQLKGVLARRLRGFIVKEEYQGKLECEFNAEEKLSTIFNLMESIKKEYHIESYAVSNQNTLVTIFLDYVANAK